ncbi:TIGR02611 family protein [Solwaraspora sp. WMMD406]|uniref:TIGR02611 family protein n=1 Tax=Solwaraspora sp. WMMD406 TaxID=3016095 RepID=UPI002416BEBA|nr:TIGR02611 family protein [Solwaraspora sp. WMMD406]MDG4766800.1 TIGR02611 family protein [Solwaraspora sp. WMMD406]
MTERPDPASPGRIAGLRRRVRMTLALIRSNPTGRIALKVGVGLLGALIVLLGLALIPLPGPGWLIVFAGLAVWGVEFHWAKRLLAFARRHVHRWTRWAARQTWPVRLAIAGVGLLLVAVVLAISLKVGLGIDVIASFLRYLATT